MSRPNVHATIEVSIKIRAIDTAIKQVIEVDSLFWVSVEGYYANGDWNLYLSNYPRCLHAHATEQYSDKDNIIIIDLHHDILSSIMEYVDEVWAPENVHEHLDDNEPPGDEGCD